jgi:hypothetical protein
VLLLRARSIENETVIAEVAALLIARIQLASA